MSRPERSCCNVGESTGEEQCTLKKNCVKLKVKCPGEGLVKLTALVVIHGAGGNVPV